MRTERFELRAEVVVVAHRYARFVKAVQDGAVELDQRTIPPEAAFGAGVKSEALGNRRQSVVPIGVGQVACANFSAHVVAVERSKRIHNAPNFEGHVSQHRQGVPLELELGKCGVLGVFEPYLLR